MATKSTKRHEKEKIFPFGPGPAVARMTLFSLFLFFLCLFVFFVAIATSTCGGDAAFPGARRGGVELARDAPGEVGEPAGLAGVAHGPGHPQGVLRVGDAG